MSVKIADLLNGNFMVLDHTSKHFESDNITIVELADDFVLLLAAVISDFTGHSKFGELSSTATHGKIDCLDR